MTPFYSFINMTSDDILAMFGAYNLCMILLGVFGCFVIPYFGPKGIF